MQLLAHLQKLAAGILLAFPILTSAYADITFTPLGDLPGGDFTSTSAAISADGTTIVGKSSSASGTAEAFRWTAADGMLGLGDLPGGEFYSEAKAVSSDGSVVVGQGVNAANRNGAWRWTAASGLGALADLAGGIENGNAVGVSADGLVIAGNGNNAASRAEAALWTGAAAPVGLGFFTEGATSEALGLSGNGSVVVGRATRANNFSAAFRWSADGGMMDLGYLPGGDSSCATAASHDGSVVIGRSFVANFGRRAFRWTAATGLVDLGLLGPAGTTSEALACSADGSVVVGYSQGGSFNDTAFIWDAANGMRSLKTLVQAAGKAKNWTQFTMATGVSADGKKITGYGVNAQGQTEAFLIDLDAPPPPPPPTPTAGLVWTEDRPQTRHPYANAALRLGYDNGVIIGDIATLTEAQNGGWGQVEYADGRILVASSATNNTGTRVHQPRYAPILVTNVNSYDLDATPGFLWSSTGTARTLQRAYPTTFSIAASAATGDRTYAGSLSRNVGISTEALQVVGTTIYFSSQVATPPGFYSISVATSNFDAPVPVFTQTGLAILDFEIVGNQIYFGDTVSNTIRRVNLDGTGLVTLVSNAMFPNSIEVTSDAIYWTELNTKLIRRAALDGTNVTTLHELDHAPRGVAVVPLSLLDGPAPQAVAIGGLTANFSGALNVAQTLDLTTSSGLPAVLEVVSGPATVAGNQITFTGSGTVVLRAVQPGNDVYAPAEQRLVINSAPRQAQTITFNPATSVAYAGSPAPLTLTATASSGLAVTFSVVSGPATRDTTTGVISVTGTGEVVIRATQSGDSTFANTFVDRTITVADAAAPQPQSIDFTPPLALDVGAAATTLSATSTSGLTPVITLVSTYPAGAATLTGARLAATAPGFAVVRATQPGGTRNDVTYAAAEPVEQVVALQPSGRRLTDLHGAWLPMATANQDFTFAIIFASDGSYYHAEQGPSDETGRTGLETGSYTWSLSGSMLVPIPELDQNGEWGLSHPNGLIQVVISGDTLLGHDDGDFFTLRRVGSTTVPLVGAWRTPVTNGEAVLVFLPNGDYLHLETAPADDAGQPGFELGDYTWTSATGALSVTTTLDLNGEWGLSHSAAPVTLTVAGNTLTARENGAVVATATRLGDSATNANLKKQTITFNPPVSRGYGSGPLLLAATATSKLPVTLEVISGSAELGDDNRTLSILGTGQVVLRATQDGDATFAAAEPINKTISVTRGTQRITFAQPAAVTYGDEPLELVATSDADLPVVFQIVSSTPANIARIDGASGLLTLLGAGRVTLRATQSGSDNIAPATPVTRVLEIRKKTLFVTGSATPSTRLVGENNPPLAASYHGFVGEDDATDLDRPPTLILRAIKTSPAGVYPITFSGGADNNYLFAAAQPTGSLTVVGFAGTYEALLLDSDHLPAGRLSIALPANALAYSGTLRLTRETKDTIVTSASKSPGTTAFARASGENVSAVWTRSAAGTDSLRLDLALAADGTLTGALVRNGEPFATLAHGGRVHVFARNQSAAWEGAHTLALHGPYVLRDEDAGDLPQGSGHAVATIAKATGLLNLTGKLGDGTPLTGSFKPRVRTVPGQPDEVDYLVWATPYAARAESHLAGQLALVPHPEPERFGTARRRSAAESTLTWRKTGNNKDKSYRLGFGPIGVTTHLDPWLPTAAARPARGSTPATAAITLPERLGLAATNSQTAALGISLDQEAVYLGQSQQNLPFAATLAALVSPTPATALTGLQPSANSTKWKLTTLSVANGSFTGSFELSDLASSTATRPTKRTVTFSGTLRQAPLAEAGALIGTGHYLLNALPGAPSPEQLSGEIRLFADQPEALPRP